MPPSVPLTFLGTGNALAQGRYFNSFLIGERVLVEPSPVVLPHLRHTGADLAAIDTVFISHFHADHTFGWPFLLLEYLIGTRRRSDLWVVGPPGIQAQLEDMIRVGFYPQHDRDRGGFDLRFVEVSGDGKEQEAGGIRFRSERVEHVPELECFGFVFELPGRRIGYSGDTRLCDGLRRLAAAADTLVLECNQRHGPTLVHMTLDDVRTLRREIPETPFILTHLGNDIDPDGIPGVRLAKDLETLHG